MKRILNNISKITLALKGEGRGVGLLLMCICAVLPQTAQAQFDLTITKHGEHAATLSKQNATSITLEYNSGNVTATARQGDGDASPATANLAHNLRYDFELISMSSGDGSDLPNGDFPAQVKRRNQAAPTYTYPTLVLVGTGTHTYTLTPSATSITLAMSGGKYVVDGNVLADKVTDIYLVSTHAAVTDAAVAATCGAKGLTEGSHCSVCNEVLVAQQTVPATGIHVCYDNGFCTVCGDLERATKVTDSNYTTLGLTASHVGYYAIANAGQLYWLRKNPTDKSVVLTEDIVDNEDVLTEDRALRGDGSNFRQWYGFHLSQNCTFDGNGHTISGLYCNGQSYAGVINTNHGTIKNLGVKDSYFSAWTCAAGVCADNQGTIQDSYATNVTTANGDYAGGVCGNNLSTIQNCHATKVTANGCNDVGGVCGRNNSSSSSIKNCYATDVTLTATASISSNAGGVCGENNGTVQDSYATNVTVTATGSTSGNAGGVCGENENHAIINNCHATDVNANASYAGGGVCGNNHGTVQDSYATNVTVTATDNIAGGVCGQNNNPGTIQNCYATNVTANGYMAAGVCGYNSATIQNCYATKVTANGGYAGGVCGKNDTSAPLKNCYTDHTRAIYQGKGKHVNGGVSKTDFASGRICWLLNGTVDDDGNWTAGVTTGTQVWYQTLETDPTPRLSGKTVYFSEEKDPNYYNQADGDLNNDGIFTIADLTLLVQLLGSNGTITNEAADVNGDGKTDTNDASSLSDLLLEVGPFAFHVGDKVRIHLGDSSGYEYIFEFKYNSDGNIPCTYLYASDGFGSYSNCSCTHESGSHVFTFKFYGNSMIYNAAKHTFSSAIQVPTTSFKINDVELLGNGLIIK